MTGAIAYWNDLTAAAQRYNAQMKASSGGNINPQGMLATIGRYADWTRPFRNRGKEERQTIGVTDRFKQNGQ